jgi:hypothetical protein
MKGINFKMATIALAFLILTVMVLSGTLQRYVGFAGVENEIGVVVLSMFGSIMFTLGIKK